MPALADIRHALRLYRRSPAPASIALLSIAVSVGATAVVFTAIRSVLIAPLPYARADELVQIGLANTKLEELSHNDWVLWSDAREIIRRSRTLAPVGVYRYAIFNLAGDRYSPPEALYGLRVTASLFPTLGVSPMLGRNILPEEDRPGGTDVMILSYGLWRRRFHGDRGIVGRAVKVNGHNCTVIGVMPPDFDFPLRKAASARTPSPYMEFWAPLEADPHALQGGMGAVGRLRAGAGLAEARQEMAGIGAALAREYPATNRDRTLRARSFRERTLGTARSGLLLLMAAALLFLLIGCANVANLLLARGLARRREFSVRLAVGAGRAHIIRQLLTESCLLAAGGGLGGYILAAAAWKVLPAVVPVSIPRLAAARADWTVLGFALVVSTINGMLFGMAPALRAAGWAKAIAPGEFGARGAAGGARDRLRSALVMAEVAVAVTLVVGGGQLTVSLLRLLRGGPGFDASGVLASIVLPASDPYRSPESRGLLFRRILDAVRGLPGVESAGTVDALPFTGENHGGPITASEAAVADPSGQQQAEVDVVSGEYLQTMGVRLKAGRWFREEEAAAANDAAIVSDAAARKLWPGKSALGRRICVFCSPENPGNWKRVVGVVASIRHAGLDDPVSANVYLAAGGLEKAQFLVVKTERPAGEMAAAIRGAIAGIDPNQPVFLSAPMRSLIADSVADRRFIVLLLAITGILALAMSAAGVYGVISYATSRRTQEIGIRMALGATPHKVQAMVFGQGLRTVAIGLAAGLAASQALTRVLGSALAGLGAVDPEQVWLAAGLVALTASAACWVPARRATRIDPMSALRQE